MACLGLKKFEKCCVYVCAQTELGDHKKFQKHKLIMTVDQKLTRFTNICRYRSGVRELRVVQPLLDNNSRIVVLAFSAAAAYSKQSNHFIHSYFIVRDA